MSVATDYYIPQMEKMEKTISLMASEVTSLRAQLAIARKALEAVSVVDAHGWAVAPMNFSLRKQIATALDAIKADPK